MARQKAMAEIDAAIAPTQIAEKKPLIPPPPVPGLTPEKAEKRANEKIAEQEQAEQDQLDQQEEARDVISEQAKNAMIMLSDLWKATQSHLGTIPTYGSIFLPLSVLLIFFFLLLPVNGHTRAVWLWLTLTGQAEITPAIGAASSGDFGGGSEGTFSSQQKYRLENPEGTFAEKPQIRPFGTFAKEDYL